MTTIPASRIESALHKARSIAFEEDTFTIDGVQVTVRNLRPSEYEQAQAAISDLEELAYLNGHQIEYVSRSIVALDDVSLRDVEFVEMEDPKDSNKTIKVERHQYLKDNLVTKWSREALQVIYKKMTEVTEKAEEKAKKGIIFKNPEENPEESVRRLLGEMRDAVGDMPPELLDQILDDFDLMKKSSVREVEVASTRLAKLEADRPAPPPQLADPDEMMRKREPLNRAVIPPPPENLARSAELAALEEGVGVGATSPGPVPTELVAPTPKLDPVEAAKVLDQKPSGGLNPRFQPRRP